ncbi:sensor histidine kinase [Streptomyces sp. NPDC091377]|uniref:sensor histidine kinase n=1 Tax=Streptomyces sp. NPDC091377 TaxID=3365995 RepID=UPI00380D6C47
MVRLLRPFVRGTTYTRLLHLFVPVLLLGVWLYVFPNRYWPITVLLIPVGLIPAVRRGEGLQARFMLVPDEPEAGISVAPSATWRDRLRTVVWLQARFLLGGATVFAAVWLPVSAVDLAGLALGGAVSDNPLLTWARPHWAYAFLVPVPLLVFAGAVLVLGAAVAGLARRLLGPSPAERLAVLEERTEHLMERTRIARELHDSIGHALTVAVVQAAAARTAGDPAFTDRALTAIEETGRTALEDLERVLGVLRESGRPVSGRPTLVDADRLLESARASGATVDAEVSGPLETVPGPASREGYRILQEALTNVLRHAGAVPVRVRIVVAGGALDLEVRNPLPPGGRSAGRGSGLRGMSERAALLGGRARVGPDEGDWRIRVVLPLG